MDNELYHHGVKGMKWGVRRYQNKDGSYTSAGKKRRDKTIDSINSNYDRYNRRLKKMADNYDSKGKTAKANIAKYMIKENEAARREKVNAIKKMSADSFHETRKQDRYDSNHMPSYRKKPNHSMMTTPLSRLDERSKQSAFRYTLKHMNERAIKDLDVKSGKNYIETLINEREHDAAVRSEAIRYAYLMDQYNSRRG